MLAACRDDQTAADATIEGTPNGAFSYYLCRAVREAGPRVERQPLIDRLSELLAEGQFSQVPQLEAANNVGPVFGGSPAEVDVSPHQPESPGPGSSKTQPGDQEDSVVKVSPIVPPAVASPQAQGGDTAAAAAAALDALARIVGQGPVPAESEATHVLAREGGMNLQTLIPAEIGRPNKRGGPPTGRWRRRMRTLLATTESRRRCGYTQRWQVETVNSMMKRNLGSALSGKTAWSRKRDMALKVLTHDVMVL